MFANHKRFPGLWQRDQEVKNKIAQQGSDVGTGTRSPHAQADSDVQVPKLVTARWHVPITLLQNVKCGTPRDRAAAGADSATLLHQQHPC